MQSSQAWPRVLASPPHELLVLAEDIGGVDPEGIGVGVVQDVEGQAPDQALDEASHLRVCGREPDVWMDLGRGIHSLRRHQ